MASANPNSLSTPGGYPKSIIVGKIDGKFICNHCQDILKDPVQSFCGHRFCQSCINGVIQSGDEIRCAICLSEGVEDDYSIIQRDQMFPDNAVRREMAKLPVKCCNEGCDWTGNFKTFEGSHLKECAFQPVPCSSCGANVPLTKKESHEKSECPRRLVSCKHCKSEVCFGDLDEHHKTCPKFPLRCDACGKKKIPREKMEQHIAEECQSQKVQCPMGCGWMERAKLTDHLHQNSDSHFLWVIQEMAQVQQLIQGMSERDSRVAAIEARLTDVINHGFASGGQSGSVDVTQEVQRQLSPVVDKNRTIDAKVNTFESIVATLHRETDKIITHLERMEKLLETAKQNEEEMKKKIISLERTLAMKDIAMTEQDLRIQSLEFASYEGALVWKVSDFTQKQQDASKGKSISIYSPAFYTSRLGYKMCARLYPNGDGMGKGSHVSLFFVVMRSHYDALLSWPFKQRVTFMLVNQAGGEHVLDSFRPDPNSSSFRRPTSDMNIASGSPLFISLDTVRNPSSGFLQDDCLYIKISVDTSNLKQPLLKDEKLTF